MNSAQQWRKSGTRAVIPCVEDDVRNRQPFAPRVVWVGDQVWTYYHGRQGELIRIGFAEAGMEDPLSWSKRPGNPVFDLGEQGGTDSRWDARPWVVAITDT